MPGSRKTAAAVAPTTTADHSTIIDLPASAAIDSFEPVIALPAANNDLFEGLTIVPSAPTAPIGTTTSYSHAAPANGVFDANDSRLSDDDSVHSEPKAVLETKKAKALRVAKLVLITAKLALLKVAKYAPAMILVTLGLVGAAMVLPKLATALLGLKLVTMTAGGLHTAGAFLLAHSPAFVITAANWVAAKAALILTLGGHVHYGVYAAKVLGFLSSMLNSFVNFVLIQGQVLTGLTAATAKTGLAGTVAAGVLATAAELAVVGATVDSVAKLVTKREPLAAVGNHVQHGVTCAASSTKRAVTSAWRGCKTGAVKVTTKVFGPCKNADLAKPAAPACA